MTVPKFYRIFTDFCRFCLTNPAHILYNESKHMDDKESAVRIRIFWMILVFAVN